MTSMTRKTLSLMAGALSLALAASPPARIDPSRIDDGARALLNRVGSSPEMGTSIGGGRLGHWGAGPAGRIRRKPRPRAGLGSCSRSEPYADQRSASAAWPQVSGCDGAGPAFPVV